MSQITVYHNAKCSKSRGALQLLDEKNIAYTQRRYLHEPLSADELAQLLKKLSLPASAIIRRGEAKFKKLFPDGNPTEAACIAALLEHPSLLERPIVVYGNSAIVARPPERVWELLNPGA